MAKQAAPKPKKDVVKNYRVVGIIPPWSAGDVIPREAFAVFPDHAVRAGVLVETTEDVTVDFEATDIPLRPPSEQSEVVQENERLRQEINDARSAAAAAKAEVGRANKAIEETALKLVRAETDLAEAKKSLAEALAEVKQLKLTASEPAKELAAAQAEIKRLSSLVAKDSK